MPNWTVGDVVETAIWLTGEETLEQMLQFRTEAEHVMRRSIERHGYRLGQIDWKVKKPGDERVPRVPDHIHGLEVRLMVAEARVAAFPGIKIEKPGFAHDLDPDDLEKLRVVTRRKYRQEFPDDPELTDRQCETLINDLGVEVALDDLRAIKPTDLI